MARAFFSFFFLRYARKGGVWMEKILEWGVNELDPVFWHEGILKTDEYSIVIHLVQDL